MIARIPREEGTNWPGLAFHPKRPLHAGPPRLDPEFPRGPDRPEHHANAGDAWWDLAGQPGYRVLHQLHLHEVAVALVVFDARSETDPLAGVRHWERALRLARQRQGGSAIPMKKVLVSARNDRGGISIGEDRLQAILQEFQFDRYFKPSAKEGWAIEELRAAIEQAIAWERMPEVLSSQLFADIKAFLLEKKQRGRLVAQAPELYGDFARLHPEVAAQEANLRDQFDTCIGRLEARDLIRRLTFGGYVLLQPEALDAYASAMVNEAKQEPDGLGSLAEEMALAGRFFVPTDQKVADAAQEQLLLHATVEELVAHDLALREGADDGRYLVFPSQFNRDYEDAPDPQGKAAAITFDGPVQSLYATLAVRLGHSGLFTTGRGEMWATPRSSPPRRGALRIVPARNSPRRAAASSFYSPATKPAPKPGATSRSTSWRIPSGGRWRAAWSWCASSCAHRAETPYPITT